MHSSEYVLLTLLASAMPINQVSSLHTYYSDFTAQHIQLIIHVTIATLYFLQHTQ